MAKIPSLLLDHEKLPAWLREAAHEIENAHVTLDNLGASRTAPPSPPDNPILVPYTLAARIAAFHDKITGEDTEEAATTSESAASSVPVSDCRGCADHTLLHTCGAWNDRG